jgi:hypothetical protein
MGELRVADVRRQVILSLFTDFEHYQVFKPGPLREKSIKVLVERGRRLELGVLQSLLPKAS